MAKDPAFLFYPGDWLGGTMLLTRHQKGCYMDLLMAQFNSGPLSLDQIKIVLGQDQAIWTVLQAKFKIDNNGMFYNEKLATEIEKRKNYVATRSNGKSGRKKSNDLSNDFGMNNHTENENRNENKVRKKKEGAGGRKKEFSPPTIEEVIQYFTENGQQEANARKAFEHYRLADWHDSKGNKVKNWKQKMHTVWFNNQNNFTNGSNSKTPGESVRKQTGADKLAEQLAANLAEIAGRRTEPPFG